MPALTSSDEQARRSARREIDIVLTHGLTVFSPEMAAKLIETVANIDKSLAVVCTKVETLEKTLLGNGHPGTCQQHADSIGALQTSMNQGKGWIKALAWACATSLAIVAILVGSFHKASDDMDAFHAAVAADQETSRGNQAAIRKSIDTAGKGAEATALQVGAIRKAQADDNQVIYIYHSAKPK